MVGKKPCSVMELMVVLIWTSTLTLAEVSQEVGNRSAAARLYHSVLDNYDPKVRSVHDHRTTTNCSLEFNLFNLLKLNEREQTISIVYFLRNHWRDEFLHWDPKDFDGLDYLNVPPENIWWPNVYIIPRVSAFFEPDVFKNDVRVFHNGTAFGSSVGRVDVACQLDMRYYPFDTHFCKLTLTTWSYTAQEVDFLNIIAPLDNVFIEENSAFEVLEIKTQIDYLQYTGESWPEVKVFIKVRRHPEFILTTILVPMTILAVISCAAFILPPSSEAKLDIQVSVMLAFTVFALLIEEMLPPSPTTPKIGVFATTMLSINAICLLVGVISIRISSSGKKKPPEALWKLAASLGKVFCATPNASWRSESRTKRGRKFSQSHSGALSIIPENSSSTNGVSTAPTKNVFSHENDEPNLSILDFTPYNQDEIDLMWLYISDVVNRVINLSLLLVTAVLVIYVLFY